MTMRRLIVRRETGGDIVMHLEYSEWLGGEEGRLALLTRSALVHAVSRICNSVIMRYIFEKTRNRPKPPSISTESSIQIEGKSWWDSLSNFTVLQEIITLNYTDFMQYKALNKPL